MENLNTAYWIWEYLKVLLGFLLIEFAWPHVVFWKHLRGKSPVYRFGFCISVQTVLINTVVLGLGLIHILNPWTMCAVFYGIPLVEVLRQLTGVAVKQSVDLIMVPINEQI